MGDLCFYMVSALKKTAVSNGAFFIEMLWDRGKIRFFWLIGRCLAWLSDVPHLPFAPPVVYSQALARWEHPGLLAAAWLGWSVPSC